VAYLLKRLIQLVLTVWAALTIIFFLFFALPGDPAELISGNNGKVPPKTLELMNKRLGLDKPILVQYGNYMKRVVKWDLGVSYKSSGESVNKIVKEKAPRSIRLGFWSMVVEVVLGLAAGIYSAIRRYSFVDTFVTFVTVAASAVPVYVLGLLFIQFAGVFPVQHSFPKWMKFPTGGLGPDSWALGIIPTGGQWKYLVLPAITLASVTTAVLARMTRTTMLEVTRSDFIRTARAKGLGESKVLVKHALRNALIPVVTLIAIDLGTAIGVAVLTESVFAWPGIGSQIAGSVGNRDFSVILGLSIVVTLFYAGANLIADLLYAFLDPRIRLDAKGVGK
jgi:ABC-type dipeptide/oligopeptide/nickel transport system permease component